MLYPFRETDQAFWLSFKIQEHILDQMFYFKPKYFN